MNATIGDIIVLDNGLKMKLILDDDLNYFKTVDINTGKDCTTHMNIDGLANRFRIGKMEYGYGVEQYEIIDIIKEPINDLSKFSIKQLLEEILRRIDNK
jgi:hypothetical protein